MIQTAIVFGDVHVPHEDKKAVSILKQVICDTQPDYVVDLGDTANFDAVNHWLIKGSRATEGTRIVKDLAKMYEFADSIGSISPNLSKLIHLTGNHERWLENFVNLTPQLIGVTDLDIHQGYKEHGWEVVKHGDFYKIGKLLFHHGDRKGYQGKYHAAMWSQIGTSVCYAHRHSAQRFSHETVSALDGKPQIHGAFSIGCLCKFSQDYMHNQKVSWNQGFAVIYFDMPKGYFNLYHVDIIEGRAIWNEKEYKG
jgi:hypothetical protein